jgi:hypothetical protein
MALTCSRECVIESRTRGLDRRRNSLTELESFALKLPSLAPAPEHSSSARRLSKRTERRSRHDTSRTPLGLKRMPSRVPISSIRDLSLARLVRIVEVARADRQLQAGTHDWGAPLELVEGDPHARVAESRQRPLDAVLADRGLGVAELDADVAQQGEVGLRSRA